MSLGAAAPSVGDVLGGLAVACGSYRLEGVDGVEALPPALVAMLHEALAEPFVNAVGSLARGREVPEPRWTLGDAWSVRVAELSRGPAVPTNELVWVQAEGAAARVVADDRGLSARLDVWAGPRAVTLVPVGQARRTTVAALAEELAALAAPSGSGDETPVTVQLSSPFDTRGRPFDLASAARAAVLTMLRRALDERPDWLARGEVKAWCEAQADLVAASFVGVASEAALDTHASRPRKSTSNAHHFRTAGRTGTLKLRGAAPCALGLVGLAVQGGRLRKLGLGDVRLSVGQRIFWPPQQSDDERAASRQI